MSVSRAYCRVNRKMVSIWLLVFMAACKPIPEEPPVSPGYDVPPIANAGKDTVIWSRGGLLTVLDGSSSTQGSTAIVKYLWKKISGPDAHFFDTTNSSVSVQLADTGLYQFQLTVRDRNGLTSSDLVAVQVKLDFDCDHDRQIRNLEPVFLRSFSMPGYRTYLGASESRFFFINTVEDLTGFGEDSTDLQILDWTQKKWLSFTYPFKDVDIENFFATGDLAFFQFMDGQGGSAGKIAILELSSGKWSEFRQLHPRYGSTITRAGSKVYFAGGWYLGDYAADIDIFDITTGVWTTSKLTVARKDMLALVLGDKVFFAGGSSATGPSNVVDVYLTTSGYSSSLTMREGRTQFTGWVNGSNIYWAGGIGEKGALYSVEVLNASTGTFSYECLGNRQFWTSSIPAIVAGQKNFIPMLTYNARMQEYELMIQPGRWSSGVILNPDVNLLKPFAYVDMQGELIQVSFDYSLKTEPGPILSFHKIIL